MSSAKVYSPEELRVFALEKAVQMAQLPNSATLYDFQILQVARSLENYLNGSDAKQVDGG